MKPSESSSKPLAAAKREIIKQIEQGASVKQARLQSPVPMHRATVYRLLKRVRNEGEAAFADGRHGHPAKVRGEVLTFLIEQCQAQPTLSSQELQQRISERFALRISISQLNRVRISHGCPRQLIPREKKADHATSE